jgi:hypothetical protein
MDPRIKRLYWQLTALLWATHFTGWAHGLPLLIALNVGQVAHFALLRRSLRAFDLQVRIGYLGLIGLGTLGPLWPVHVVQFVGVNALLVADYCPLARMLVLMPWNRPVPWSWGLLLWAIFSPPLPGSIQARVPR